MGDALLDIYPQAASRRERDQPVATAVAHIKLSGTGKPFTVANGLPCREVSNANCPFSHRAGDREWRAGPRGTS